MPDAPFIIISDYSFHDSEILRVTENHNQILEFLIDFPTDWNNNIFEYHLLKFHDVISYKVDEIPFAGPVTILEINELKSVAKMLGHGENAIKTTRNKIEMITNAGSRTIEYTDCYITKA